MKKYLGDRRFYRQFLTLIIPIMLQQLFVSIAGYVDNLMINSYGGNELAYNGVSAANRLMFVCNFVWMGLAATASIFIAQYFGAKDEQNVKLKIIPPKAWALPNTRATCFSCLRQPPATL